MQGTLIGHSLNKGNLSATYTTIVDYSYNSEFSPSSRSLHTAWLAVKPLFARIKGAVNKFQCGCSCAALSSGDRCCKVLNIVLSGTTKVLKINQFQRRERGAPTPKSATTIWNIKLQLPSGVSVSSAVIKCGPFFFIMHKMQDVDTVRRSR